MLRWMTLMVVCVVALGTSATLAVQVPEQTPVGKRLADAVAAEDTDAIGTLFQQAGSPLLDPEEFAKPLQDALGRANQQVGEVKGVDYAGSVSMGPNLRQEVYIVRYAGLPFILQAIVYRPEPAGDWMIVSYNFSDQHEAKFAELAPMLD